MNSHCLKQKKCSGERSNSGAKQPGGMRNFTKVSIIQQPKPKKVTALLRSFRLPISQKMLISGYGGRHYHVLDAAPAAPVSPVHDIQVLKGAFQVGNGAVGINGPAAFQPPQFFLKGIGVFSVLPFG